MKRLLHVVIFFACVDFAIDASSEHAITIFLEYPILYAQLLAFSVWLAWGSQHSVIRLATTVTFMSGLFLLLSAGSFSNDFFLVGEGEVWGAMQWVGYLGTTVPTIFFGLPGILLTTTIPLMICRFQFGNDDRPQLRLFDLLTAITLICITFSLFSSITPYPSWTFEFLREGPKYIGNSQSVVFLLVVLPALIYPLSAFAVLIWFAKFRSSYWLVATTCLAVAGIQALVEIGSLRIFTDLDMNYSMFDFAYVVGQNLIAFVVITVTLPVLCMSSASQGS